MDHNFGGNSNQRPQFPGFIGQNLAGMHQIPTRQGFQSQPFQQSPMNAGYPQPPQMQANQASFGQFASNIPRPQIQQMYIQQQPQQPYQQQYQQQQQRQQYQQQHFQQQQYQQQQQQQYQKMIEQQQKIAQEQQKKEIELRKKRDFEMQQKRLQQLGGGQRKGGGGGDLSHLIGSLAQRSTDKQVALKPQVGTPSGRSFFARPGTSYPPQPEWKQQKDQLVQSDITGQHTGRPTIEPHGLTGPGIATSDGFGGQATDDDQFSDFQEAQVPFSSQTTSVSTNQNTGWSLQPGNQSMPGQPGSHGIAWQSYSGTNTGISSEHGSPVVNQMSFAQAFSNGSITTAHYSPHVFSEPMPRERTDSQSSISSSTSSGVQSTASFQDRQLIMPNQSFPNDGRQGQPPVPHFVGLQHRMSGNLSEGPAITGQFFSNQPVPGQVNVPGQTFSNQPVPGQVNVPGQAFSNQPVSGQVDVPGNDCPDIEEKEESEEEKLQRLYGITIPEWCKEDKNLPGVYKDVKEAATKNGAIDTGSLYPILLASELQRDILGQIWNRANKATPGQLNDLELRMVLGLVALGQTGLKVERLTLEKLSTCKSAPIPTIPENVLQPSEGSWSFQKETTQQDSIVEKTSIPSVSQPGSTLHSNEDYAAKTEALKPTTTGKEFGGFTGWSVSGQMPGQNDFTLGLSTSILGAQMSSQIPGLTSSQTTSHRIQNTTTLKEAELKPGLSSSPEFQGFQSASVGEHDDFGDFHGSTSSVDTTTLSSQNTFAELKSTTTLASSLESFKLKTENSLFSSVTPAQNSKRDSKLTALLAENTVKTDSDKTIAFPAISMPPSSVNWSSLTNASTTENKPALANFNLMTSITKNPNEKGQDNNLESALLNNTSNERPSDKYDLLRDINSEETSSIFSSSIPSRKKDDSFGDFESFENAESKEDDNFGGFQSTTIESTLQDSSSSNINHNWNAFASAQSSQEVTTFAQFNLTPNITGKVDTDEFGDFSEPSSVVPPSISSNMDFFSSNQSTIKVNVSGFGNFDDSHKNSSSLASFTSGVPLDSAQRYKQLCGEDEDADQHGNVWGRCLNSCLLTMATCALAVQTMSDATIKQEILQSKKGMDYFKAIIEVFRVTKRIQASLVKTDFLSEKLKDILEEINQTWRNIANFLKETNLEQSSTIKENFTEHHVQADDDKMVACGLCLLNVTKATDSKIGYGGREYHSACANFWCNRVDSILPSLWPVNSLI